MSRVSDNVRFVFSFENINRSKSCIRPILHRLHQKDDSLTHVRLYDGMLNDNDMKLLAAGLAYYNNNVITELFLSCNAIGGEGIRALVKALLQTTPNRVSRIYLTKNQIGPDSCQALATLVSCCHVRELYLARNGIGNDGVELLANGLVNKTTVLEKLDLRENGIDDGRGLRAVEKLLINLSNLQWLYLWGNSALSCSCSDKEEHKQQNVLNHSIVLNGIKVHCQLQPRILKGVCVGCKVLSEHVRNYIAWNNLCNDLLIQESNHSPIKWTPYMAKISNQVDLLYDFLRHKKPELIQQGRQDAIICDGDGKKRSREAQQGQQCLDAERQNKRRRKELNSSRNKRVMETEQHDLTTILGTNNTSRMPEVPTYLKSGLNSLKKARSLQN